MVPTELLAIQHHEHLLNLLEKLDIEPRPSIALLTGATPSKQSRVIREVCISMHSFLLSLFPVMHCFCYWYSDCLTGAPSWRNINGYWNSQFDS